LLSAKNLKNNKISINEDDRKISKVDFDRIYKNYNLKRGDLLLSIVGTIGNVAIVKDPENIAFQRSVAILRMRNEFEINLKRIYFKLILLRKNSNEIK
jgi:type I restriction enzyme S subunit